MGDTDRMDLSEVNVSRTTAPAQVAPQEDRLTRLERMLENLLEEKHWQQESFADGGLAKTLQGNNPLRSSRTDAELEHEQRRKSIIVNTQYIKHINKGKQHVEIDVYMWTDLTDEFKSDFRNKYRNH